MAMGMAPSYSNSSFANSGNDNDYNIQNQFKYETNLCYLPTPYINIACYVVTAVVSGLVLLCKYDLRANILATDMTLPLRVNRLQSLQLEESPIFLKEQDEAKEVVMSLISTMAKQQSAAKIHGRKMKELGAMSKRTGLVQFFETCRNHWHACHTIVHLVHQVSSLSRRQQQKCDDNVLWLQILIYYTGPYHHLPNMGLCMFSHRRQ